VIGKKLRELDALRRILRLSQKIRDDEERARQRQRESQDDGTTVN